jgi:WD40-like Beta Propeller Repeat
MTEKDPLRIGRLAVAVCCVAAAFAAAAVGAAAARTGFGSEGVGAGQFEQPQGIAADQSSGALYIADKNDQRVDELSPAGVFVAAWGWGVEDGSTAALQQCTTTCFAGIEGAGSGQFDFPEGLAVDSDPLSSSEHDVYVVDSRNLRVEKFDAEGHFLLMFGGEVDKTKTELRAQEEKEGRAPKVAEAEENVCTAASGDVCQAGVEGTGDGQFSSWPSPNGGFIGVGPGGRVYVGDENRVQEFNADGAYEGQLALPGDGRTTALAVAANGDLYVESENLAGVQEYGPSGAPVGTPLDSAGQPRAIALDAAGDLYVEDAQGSEHILEYSPSGAELASFDYGADGGSRGIALDGADHELYVLAGETVTATSPPPPGPLVDSSGESASGLMPTSATLEAVVNPEGHATRYHFEYGETASYSVSTSAVALPEAGFENGTAVANITGLQPDTTYHYRVVATSTAGTSFGPDETFRTLPPVLIDEVWASNVASTSAVLAAHIDPLGVETKYDFEYGPTSLYGSTVPTPDGVIAADSGGITVEIPIQELQPDTAYHYRVTTENALGVVQSTDYSFTTQVASPGATPADDRVWEMVSPPSKHGGQIEGLETIHEGGAVVQAATSGEAITYAANGPILGDPLGSRGPENQQILSRRDGTNWETQELATPNSSVTGHLSTGNLSEYKAFSPDLSVGLLEPEGETNLTGAAGEEGVGKRIYLRDTAGGSYESLLTSANVPPGTKFGGLVSFDGASPDLSHIVVSSTVSLVAGFAAPEGVANLYEWSEGQLQPVSIFPGGAPASEANQAASLGYFNDDVRHAVANDGSRVVWTAEGHLYLRDLKLGQTLRLDAAQGAPEPLVGGAHFEAANSDDSRVFFTDEQRLTANSSSGARSGLPHADLYECEVIEVNHRDTCILVDLSADPTPGESAAVQGAVLGVSEDGSYVYFVATGVLTDAENARGETAVSGQPNLYLRHFTESGWAPPTFIARLTREDAPEWEGRSEGAQVSLNDITARVSPNGRYLAFMSARSLSGYDNHDALSGAPDEEVFLYDASGNRVLCASCDPTGARPTGVFDPPGVSASKLLVDRRQMWAEHWLAGSIPGWTGVYGSSHGYYQPRYLLDSGELFFDSPDALVPQATNGRMDVYEFEPAGQGTCGAGSENLSEVTGGCVGLLSSGTSQEESEFLDASESGNDVFFLTAAALVPEDRDSAYDVYDAHFCDVQSECAAPALTAVPECGTAESCRVLSQSQPAVLGVPASATFSGPTDVSHASTAKKTNKSKTRKHGKTKKRRKAKKRTGRQRRKSVQKKPALRSSGSDGSRSERRHR